MEDKKMNVLISADELRERIRELGEEITKRYKGQKLYVLSLLRGSFIFTADLVRAMDTEVKIGFMTTSSYGHGEETAGRVTVVTDIADDLEGFNVLVVDDIIDTGITMDFVMKHVMAKGAKAATCCTLLDKPSRRRVEIVPDFCGFVIDDIFVAGYGLNYGDYYRNIPFVFNWQ